MSEAIIDLLKQVLDKWEKENKDVKLLKAIAARVKEVMSENAALKGRVALLERVMQESVDNCPCKRENITPGCARCETFKAALAAAREG